MPGSITVVFVSVTSAPIFFVSSISRCTTCRLPFPSGFDVARTTFISPPGSDCFSSSVSCTSVLSPLPKPNVRVVVRTVLPFTCTDSFSITW